MALVAQAAVRQVLRESQVIFGRLLTSVGVFVTIFEAKSLYKSIKAASEEECEHGRVLRAIADEFEARLDRQ